MSKFFMIRHPEYDDRVRPSSQAPLTDAGLARAQLIARRLAARGLGRIKLVSSPYTRARQLAEAIAASTGASVEVAGWAADGPTSSQDVLEAADWDAIDTLIIASHEPALRLALDVAGAPEVERIPNGTIAEFDFDPAAPKLRLIEIRA